MKSSFCSDATNAWLKSFYFKSLVNDNVSCPDQELLRLFVVSRFSTLCFLCQCDLIQEIKTSELKLRFVDVMTRSGWSYWTPQEPNTGCVHTGTNYHLHPNPCACGQNEMCVVERERREKIKLRKKRKKKKRKEREKTYISQILSKIPYFS